VIIIKQKENLFFYLGAYMKKLNILSLAVLVASGLATTAQAAQELRLLTWGGYAPKDVVELFEKETGISVKVTKSNNEEMISKLKATRGAGFDLVQPSQDRVASAQKAFNIYKPMDLSKIDSAQFIGSMLAATKGQSTVDGEVFAVPHVWGSSGLIVNRAIAADIKDYTDLCNPAHAGKVTYRLKRPTLIGFAFAMGEDPFAAYGDADKYQQIMEKVGKKLTECKANVKAYWSGGDALLSLMRSGETTAAMAWDAGGWKLNRDNADITFVAPTSGALGWIDTFVLPRKTKNEAAAYQWINFVMRPDIAAKITASAGNFTASKGSDDFVAAKAKAQYQESFSAKDIDNIKWYPPVPAGLEKIEGKILDRVKAS